MPLPKDFLLACRRLGRRLSRHVLLVWIGSQRLDWFERVPTNRAANGHGHRGRYVISTSRLGPGQVEGSNQTPLGLHQVAEKVGQGWPVGTVFASRKVTGFVWDGIPEAPIAHRILWLDGLEPGFNRGGGVDSFRRFIYIHGLGPEPGLGRPASRGCIHLAAKDLIPMFDRVPVGSVVWMSAGVAPRLRF